VSKIASEAAFTAEATGTEAAAETLRTFAVTMTEAVAAAFMIMTLGQRLAGLRLKALGHSLLEFVVNGLFALASLVPSGDFGFDVVQIASVVGEAFVHGVFFFLGPFFPNLVSSVAILVFWDRPPRPALSPSRRLSRIVDTSWRLPDTIGLGRLRPPCTKRKRNKSIE